MPQIGRSLDLHSKLLLSTGPYADAAAVIEECWLAAIEALIARHGGPVWDEESFDALREHVRAEVYDETERAVQQRHRDAAGARRGDCRAGDRGRRGRTRPALVADLSAGSSATPASTQLRRLPLYLEAARRRLDGAADRRPAGDAGARGRFHERTAGLSVWARLAPDVQHVRWALEELRLSLLAQDLRRRSRSRSSA